MPISRLFHLQGQRAGPKGSDRYFSLNPIWWIIGINFLLFILTFINRNVIYEYLGLIPVIFIERPWTILTAMFVHAGFWHIFGNMITLFFFGRALTMLVGRNKFLLVYFVGGIVGNIFYLWLGEPVSLALGASGAVFAVAGALGMMRPNIKVLVYFIVPMPLWLVIILFFGIWSIPGFVLPNVAWQAHLGGLITGLVTGYYFRKKERYYYFR